MAVAKTVLVTRGQGTLHTHSQTTELTDNKQKRVVNARRAPLVQHVDAALLSASCGGGGDATVRLHDTGAVRAVAVSQ